jgi:hypothetical protein
MAHKCTVHIVLMLGALLNIEASEVAEGGLPLGPFGEYLKSVTYNDR